MSTEPAELPDRISDLIKPFARQNPDHPALVQGDVTCEHSGARGVIYMIELSDAAPACKAAQRRHRRAAWVGNARRRAAAATKLHAGVALHYGNLSYGNIGSGTRLDFTVMGPEVNLVSRIQTACGATGCPLFLVGCSHTRPELKCRKKL